MLIDSIRRAKRAQQHGYVKHAFPERKQASEREGAQGNQLAKGHNGGIEGMWNMPFQNVSARMRHRCAARSSSSNETDRQGLIELSYQFDGWVAPKNPAPRC
jgi:hypothetical protein